MPETDTKLRDDAYTRAVAELVRAARKARGWTQAELAHRLDIESATLSRYEVGARAFPLPLLARCADVLGVSPASLLPGVPPQPEARKDDLVDAWDALDEHRRHLLVRLAQELARR